MRVKHKNINISERINKLDENIGNRVEVRATTIILSRVC
jgi:hypothetical protein